MATDLASQGPDQALRRPCSRGQRGLVRRRTEIEILSVIGPNGAGKSTIFGLISSFVKLSRGEVTFNGEVISGLAPHTVARKGVVRTFQETTDLQGHDGARQRHRRPPPALACKPLRLLSWVRCRPRASR